MTDVNNFVVITSSTLDGAMGLIYLEYFIRYFGRLIHLLLNFFVIQKDQHFIAHLIRVGEARFVLSRIR